MQKAWVLESKDKPLSLQDVPIPEAGPGSVVVKILATAVPPMAKGVFNNTIPFPLVYPLIPGHTAVGRVHKLGPDATTVSEGQLVFVNFFVQSRDDPNASILLGYLGGYDPYSNRLMDGEWRNGTLAQYTKLPLENIHPLNEEVLVNKLGYTLGDLNWLGPCLVPAGGLMEIDVRAGETVIVAPATGFFSGAAVHMALGMGARVIAAARNAKALAQMAETFKSTERLVTVQLKGDVEQDSAALKAASGSPRGADAFIDFSPPTAPKSTHLQAAIWALRPFGRAALMGGVVTNVEIPYVAVMSNSLRIQGRYMLERSYAERAIGLVEAKLLKLGPGDSSGIKSKTFKFGDIEQALDTAQGSGWGTMVVMDPWS